MRSLIAGMVLLVCAVPALAQEAPAKQVPAPQSLAVVAKVPLQTGLTVDIEWVPLAGRSRGRLYSCSVVTVDAKSVAYRTLHNNVLHTIANRDDCANYTGNWSEQSDDQLPHTWPWIPLAAARQLGEAQAGQTKVKLGDLLAGEMREYLFAGRRLVPCVCNGEPALVPCWVLVSGNGATISALADPENPLLIESYEPGLSMQRTLAIKGSDIGLKPLAD